MSAKRLIWPAVFACLIVGCSKEDPITSGGRTASYWAGILTQPDPDVALRRKAAVKLGPLVLLDETALPALVGALHDPDSQVRIGAARSLSVYTGSKAEEVLPTLLEMQGKETNKKVRLAFEQAIKRIQSS